MKHIKKFNEINKSQKIINENTQELENIYNSIFGGNGNINLIKEYINNKQVLEYIFDQNIDPNTNNGILLRLAIQYSNEDIVKFLLDKGCDLSQRNYIAISKAIENENISLIDFLFSYMQNKKLKYPLRTFFHDIEFVEDKKILHIMMSYGMRNYTSNDIKEFLEDDNRSTSELSIIEPILKKLPNYEDYLDDYDKKNF